MSDTLDLLTLEEATAAINSPNPSATVVARLERMVTAISRDIDRLCGPVVQRSVTERLSPAYGTHRLQLAHFPIASVTTVTEYTAANASGTALTADDEDSFAVYGYLLDGEVGHLYRRSNGHPTAWAAGDRNIVAVYVAGRYVDTASVDARFKMAAESALRVMWQQEAGRWAQRPDFPVDVEDIPGYLSVEDMVRRRLPGDLVGPSVW